MALVVKVLKDHLFCKRRDDMARNLFSSIGDFIEDLGSARRAASAYQRLSRMSDAELARRGYSRADLPRIAMKQGFGY